MTNIGESMKIERTNSRFKNEINVPYEFQRTYVEKTGRDIDIVFTGSPTTTPVVSSKREDTVSLREIFDERFKPQPDQVVRNNYHADGTTVKVQFVYDDNGNKVSQIQYNEDGTPSAAFAFGEETDEVITFYKDGTYSQNIRDKDNNLKESNFYSESGDLVQKTAYVNNKKSSVTHFDPSTGHKIQQTVYVENEQPSKSYFDPSTGNIIQQTSYHNGKTNMVFYDKNGKWEEKQVLNSDGKLLEQHWPVEGGKVIRDMFDVNTGKLARRVCYDEVTKRVLTTAKCDSEGNFIDAANGRFDKVISQSSQVGDCWVLSGIVSLSNTKEGQKILSDNISISRTGAVTVKIAGEPGKDNPKTYTFTQQQLQSATHLSEGDYDVRAFELAFEKFFKEEQPYGQYSINGGSSAWTYELLTGKKAQSVALESGITSSEIPPNTPLVCDDIDAAVEYFQTKQPNVAMSIAARASEDTNHSYVINKIENGKVYLTESHNTANEAVYTIEDFKANFGTLITPEGSVPSRATFMVLS